MDASAVIAKEAWDRNRKKLNLEEIKISDNRNNYAVYRRLSPSSAAILVGLRSSSPLRITPPGQRGLSWHETGRWRTWRPGEITQPWTSLTTDQTSVPAQNQPCCEEDWYLRGRQYRWRYLLIKQRVIFISVFSLDFSRIFENSSLLCLGCILIPPSLSNLQTSRFVMITVISRNNHHQCQVVHHHHYLHSAKTKKGFQSRLQKSQLSS